MESELVMFFIMLFAGIIAGIVNILSAGGSLFTLPIFIFFGLDPVTANGTNRIAIVTQSVFGAYSFYRHDMLDIKTGFFLSMFVLPGALVGIFFGIKIEPKLFQQILAGVMVISLAGIFYKPSNENSNVSFGQQKWILVPGLLIVGLFGGFIQAGVGFLIMPLLYRFWGKKLVEVNMYKIIIILIYNIPALILFGISGHIHWEMGIYMAVGNAIGASIAAKIAVRGGDLTIKIATGLMIVAMAGKLYYDALAAG